MIRCAGIVASPLTNFLNGERDVFGRLQVDPFLKLPGHLEVIVAGDVANVPVDADGYISLMACQFSMDLGKWAENEICFTLNELEEAVIASAPELVNRA